MDTSFLLYLFAEPGEVGTPLQNGQPIPFAKERVAALVSELEKLKATIIVGTPAMSELMIRSGVPAGQQWLAIMKKSTVFKVVPFDEKSAVEVAIMAGHALEGEKGTIANGATYAKLKYDRQIVAIAHTEGATAFYSDDDNQRTHAARLGMNVKGLADCIVPPTASQSPLQLVGGRGEKPVKTGQS